MIIVYFHIGNYKKIKHDMLSQYIYIISYHINIINGEGVLAVFMKPDLLYTDTQRSSEVLQCLIDLHVSVCFRTAVK